MAQRVIERPERLFPAVDVDDRDAIDGRGERGGRGLEPVAGEQERIHGRRPKASPDRDQRGRRLDVGGRIAGALQPAELGVGREPIGHDLVDRLAVAVREVRATDPQLQLQVGMRPDRGTGAVDDPPVLSPGRQDRDPSRVAPRSREALHVVGRDHGAGGDRAPDGLRR